VVRNVRSPPLWPPAHGHKIISPTRDPAGKVPGGGFA
jgi:hypothetical protein